MTQVNPNPEDDRKRTIVLIYGVFDLGIPFWVFAAVRPERYQEFQVAYKEKQLDLQHFEPFGEILVCGEGKSPPDSVTLKVAEMYQTSAATLMGSLVDAPE